MKKVNDILKFKGNDVWSIGPEASVYDAINLMTEKKVGALMVVEGGKLVGVVSETDYTRKIILKGLTSRKTPVKAIMTKRVLYVQPEQDIEECMVLMTEKRTRHLPVMDEGKLVGVISIGDAVKSVIDEQRFTIEQLERYITG
ncbi:MAG: CBS domain-containing protein [Gammaproteobacteria bacterium]|nr:CBS domain-containing protein [Gammaproteobacteria bacterium]